MCVTRDWTQGLTFAAGLYPLPFFFLFYLTELSRLSWNLLCSPSKSWTWIVLLPPLKWLQRQVCPTILNFTTDFSHRTLHSQKVPQRAPCLPDVLAHSSLPHWTGSRNHLSATTSITSPKRDPFFAYWFLKLRIRGAQAVLGFCLNRISVVVDAVVINLIGSRIH